MVNRLGKCGGSPPLGQRVMGAGGVLGVGPPAGIEAPHTCRDKGPNDHLLLFVSRSTKQHLFPQACLQSALMDSLQRRSCHIKLLFHCSFDIYFLSIGRRVKVKNEVTDSCLENIQRV